MICVQIEGNQAQLEKDGAIIWPAPGPLSRDEIGELTGYTRSSRNTYLQRLSAKELIEMHGVAVTASPMMLFEK